MALWQPAPLLFPDAETVIPDGFRTLLAAADRPDVWVDRKVPDDRPDRGIAFTRDGGTPNGAVDRPRMRCRVWDVDDESVNDLAALVVALAPRLVTTGAVSFAGLLSGPLDVTDKSGPAQRLLIFEFHTRGVPL